MNRFHLCSAVVLFTLAIQAVARLATGPIESYYPLAKGNHWRYEVRKAGQPVTRVEWRVTSARNTETGFEYQVWPSPAQSDDEAMTLRFSKHGIEETSSGTIIVRFPVINGDSWSSEKPNRRTFRVISAGKSCRVGRGKSEDCLMIADDDDALPFRTVTTYARGVGPIKYVYYGKQRAVSAPIQTLEITSFKLVAK